MGGDLFLFSPGLASQATVDFSLVTEINASLLGVHYPVTEFTGLT